MTVYKDLMAIPADPPVYIQNHPQSPPHCTKPQCRRVLSSQRLTRWCCGSAPHCTCCRVCLPSHHYSYQRLPAQQTPMTRRRREASLEWPRDQACSSMVTNQGPTHRYRGDLVIHCSPSEHCPCRHSSLLTRETTQPPEVPLQGHCIGYCRACHWPWCRLPSE